MPLSHPLPFNSNGAPVLLFKSCFHGGRVLSVTAIHIGICKSANAEHARDLPIMNGIKEALKSIGALDPGTSAFLEALSNLSARLDILQENCKQHFEEEEEQVFPLMEAAEVSREQQGSVLNQCIEVMRGTHSHLGFFIDGLLPSEAMQYLDLIMHYVNKETAAVMLRALVEYNLN